MRITTTSSDRLSNKRHRTAVVARLLGCLALAAFFLVAGVLHFRVWPEFAKIVPPFLPLKREVVLLTGAIEIAFAVGLVVRRWRRVTGWLLCAYLLAVLPANVYEAMARVEIAGVVLPDWAAWTRVALQFPLIAVVLLATREPAAGA